MPSNESNVIDPPVWLPENYDPVNDIFGDRTQMSSTEMQYRIHRQNEETLNKAYVKMLKLLREIYEADSCLKNSMDEMGYTSTKISTNANDCLENIQNVRELINKYRAAQISPQVTHLNPFYHIGMLKNAIFTSFSSFFNPHGNRLVSQEYSLEHQAEIEYEIRIASSLVKRETLEEELHHIAHYILEYFNETFNHEHVLSLTDDMKIKVFKKLPSLNDLDDQSEVTLGANPILYTSDKAKNYLKGKIRRIAAASGWKLTDEQVKLVMKGLTIPLIDKFLDETDDNDVTDPMISSGKLLSGN
ncbi:hypothetical protein SNEBB_006268 [Seison nebaliae]|nr:hypothetical protein SNEBB_006268 [Seison nebaliae]